MQQNLMCQEHRLAVCSWDPARPPQQFEPRKRTRQHGLPIESQLTKGTGILGQCGCGCAGKRDAGHDEDSERGRSGNRVLRCTDREIDVFRTAPPQIGKVPCAQNHLRQLGRYTAKCEVVSRREETVDGKRLLGPSPARAVVYKRCDLQRMTCCNEVRLGGSFFLIIR